jgi:selenocysteine lyase/cysteine desulfurase
MNRNTTDPYDPNAPARALDPRFEILPVRRRSLLGAMAAVGLGGWHTPLASAALVAPADPPAANDENWWRYVAEQFMLRPGLAYMNSGTRGPSPRVVYEAQVQAIEAANVDRLGYAEHIYNKAFKAQLHRKLAAFVGCQAHEIALTNNTTEGMVLGTFGADLKRGDEIIYTNHDHSSGAQPINLHAARYGTRPVVVDLSDPRFHPPDNPEVLIEAVAKAITRRTRLISICHVNYNDGCVMPVKEICELARSRGILTLVDGAHPPGMMEMDVHDLGCDMYAGACHKWMLAGMLTGFFYVREDVLERIWPLAYSGPVGGRNMYGAEVEDVRATTAEKFEIHGSNNYAAGMSVDAAIDFHERIGRANIERRARHLAAQTRAGLAATPGVELFVGDDERLSAGIVSFRVRGKETKALASTLWKRHRIYLRNTTHEEIGWDANRASLHIMVTMADVDRLVGAVREIARETV